MALNNFIGKRKWKSHFEAGREALEAGDLKAAEHSLQLALEQAVNISEKDSAYGDTALLLGQVYRRTDQRREADDMAKKAFKYYSDVFGVTDPRTVQAHLAIVLANPDKSHDDMDVRKATYELARSQFGDQSWQTVRTAALALPTFSSQEREKLLASVQTACSAMLGEKRMELATWPPVAEEFSFALLEQNYGELAAKFMGIQLRLNEERFGEKSQEAALARLNLGELFLANGYAAKAEIAFSRAIDLIKLKVGPRSPEVQRATISLARSLAQQKKLGEAAPHLTEALTLLGSDQIDERLEVLVALLEQKCLVAGTDSERGALWQELESLWERTHDHSVKQQIFEGLLAAQNRLQQGWELTSADRFLHAVLARVRKWRGPHHPNVAHVMMELAACSIGSDDKSKAKSFLDQSVALDEGLDNLIRAVRRYAELGDRSQAKTYAERAQKLLKSGSSGVETGRREQALAEALLIAGDLDGCLDYASKAEAQLPESEQLFVYCVMARAHVLLGDYEQAIELFKKGAPRLTDPYERARAFLHLAWIFTRQSKFAEAKSSLEEIDKLLKLRADHPLAYQAKAVRSQVAFYSGSVYEGREIRQEVLQFLNAGHHIQASRSIGHLVLLEPYGPEEGQDELDLGTQLLAATEFPHSTIGAFPVSDAACVGLRHTVRALHFSEQDDLAKDRLSQYRERFFESHSQDSPLAYPFHLTQALLATEDEEKANALESALAGIREISPTHVSLFPTLSKLAELQVKLGNLDRARSHCRAATEIRQSPRLMEWLESLEKGVLPSVDGKSSPRKTADLSTPPAPTPEPVAPEPEISEPPMTEPEPEEVSSEPSVEPSAEELSEPPAPTSEPNYQPPPQTEHEDDLYSADRPTIQEEPSTAHQEMPAEVIAATGASNLAELQLARFLSERAEAPTPEETDEFLNEVKARFGEEVQPNLEARVLLALLFPDGAAEAASLWSDALALISAENSVDLLTVENRARDASSWSLVVQTLEERLSRESSRHGENAVETLETQMRLAKAHEAKGDLTLAYRRLTMVAEILRSWFGARSRRLLAPLAELIRVAESLNDVQAAFEHQLERHRLLEAADGDAEELFNSRITLLPIRGRLGQVNELLEEAHVCEQELIGFRGNAASEFVRILLTAAQRLDQLHWRCDGAATLLEIALRVLPENEVSLGCRVRVALAECQYRKDYRSQAARIREEALQRANGLDADTRAEILHSAAQSCLRIQEIPLARSIAEQILEERIAQAGRKDIWAGRALLVLAEADLKTFRLEGTETAIGMSAPSLKGTRYWNKAQALKLQALFFLNRFDEAYEILDSMSGSRALDLELQLAVWRGNAADYVRQIQEEAETPLTQRWADFELLPLGQAVNTLEFFARCGQVALMAEGMTRIWGRITPVLQTDIRHARLKVASACLQFWEEDWDGTASTLQRTIEMVPEGAIEFPEGLTANLIREAMLTCFLKDGRSTSALAQAQQGVAESAELLGEEDIRAISFKVKLAQCAHALGQLEDALALLDDILGPLQDTVGETHVLLRDVYRGLATTFLSLDDIESARMSAEEALRIDKECRGLSVQFLQDLELLAEIESLEDVPEAVNVIDTALELATQVLPPNHPYEARLKNRREILQSTVPEDEEPPTPQAEMVEPEEEESVEQDSPDNLFDEPAEEEEAEAVVEEVAEESVEDSAESESAELLFGGEEADEEEPEQAEEQTAEQAQTTDSPESLFGEPDAADEEDEDPDSLIRIDEEAEETQSELEDSDKTSLFDEEDDDFELSEEERAELSGEGLEPSEAESEPESDKQEADDADSGEYLEGWVDAEELEEQAADTETDEAEELAEVEAEESDEQDWVQEAVAEAEEEAPEEIAEADEDPELDEVEEAAESEDSEEELVEEKAAEEDTEADEEAEPEVEEAAEEEWVEEEAAESEDADEEWVEEVAEVEEEAADEDAEADEEAEPEVEESAEEEWVEEEAAESEDVDEEWVEEVAEVEEAAEDEVAEEAAEVEEEADQEELAEEEEELVEAEALDESEEPEAEEEFVEEVAEAEEPESAEIEPEEPEENEAEPEEEEDAEDASLGLVAAVETDYEVEDEQGQEDLPRPYRVSAAADTVTPVSTSSSVEMAIDFPEVPLRMPHISEPETPEPIEESQEESKEEAPVSEEAEESVEVEESSEAEVTDSPAAEEISLEAPISLEQLLDISDPESHMLPLAPIFFLPVPWKEATEASFDDEYEDLYRQFQVAFKKNGHWRPVIEESVSVVRSKPCHASAYFLFLLGAQLEKGGHLHTADVCLATAIELLEDGPSLGAACHLAGRVSGRRGELRRALDYFNRAESLAGEEELAVLKIDAAECHLGLGRPEEALIGFEEVFDFIAENAPKVQALAVQAKMAQIHLLIGDPDTSQALAEETRSNLSPKNAGTYRVLGRILLSRAFARLGRHELALELAEKAWEGAEPWSAKRKDGRRIAISNLVDIYCVVGKFDDADKLIYESGLTGWGLAEAELLLRAGHVACARDQLDRANQYVRLGRAFLQRFQSPALWRSCFAELEAEVCLRAGDFEAATEFSANALRLFETEATGPVDRSRHIVRAAKIAGAKGELDKARDLVEQAHSLRDLHLGSDHPHTSSVEGLTAVLSSED